MTHKEQNIDDYHSGDDLRIEVTVEEDGSTKDLTGASATYQVYEQFSGTKDVQFEKTTDDDVNIVDAANGRLDIRVNGSETEDMDGTYEHSLRVSDSAGNTTTVFTGLFEIHP